MSFDPSSQPRHSMGGGDSYTPGEQPDEVGPGLGDTDRPGQAPDEVQPGQGDFDRPDNSPAEAPQPASIPTEMPPPD